MLLIQQPKTMEIPRLSSWSSSIQRESTPPLSLTKNKKKISKPYWTTNSEKSLVEPVSNPISKRILPWTPSILVVYIFGHLPFWPSSILVPIYFGRHPFQSSSIFGRLNQGVAQLSQKQKQYPCPTGNIARNLPHALWHKINYSLTCLKNINQTTAK